MVIHVGDLDKDVKGILRNNIMSALFKEYTTLPEDRQKIDTVVSKLKSGGTLDDTVRSYYEDMTEHKVDVAISEEDYSKVWLHLV